MEGSQNESSTSVSTPPCFGHLQDEQSLETSNNGYASVSGYSESSNGPVEHIVSNDCFVVPPPELEDMNTLGSGSGPLQQPSLSPGKLGQNAEAEVAGQTLYNSQPLAIGNSSLDTEASQQSVCSETEKNVLAVKKPEPGMQRVNINRLLGINVCG